MKKIFPLLCMLFACFAISINAQPQQESYIQLQKLQMAEMAISRLYVDSINEGKLVEDAIRHMISTLDPHSAYSPPKESKRLNESMQAEFSGIGVEFQMLDDTLLVITTVVDGPSERVGILPGDRIITVNDNSIAGQGLPNDSILSILRGPKGTQVRVGILRRGVNELIPFSIIRDKIPIYSLDAAYMVDKGIGYIRLSRFATTTYDEFMVAVSKLQKQGMKDLIIDLQSNGGGDLQVVTKMVSEFFEKDQLIVYAEGRTQPRHDFKSDGVGTLRKNRVVVLVDSYSASASEILAGAIQDWDRGVVVGRRTFGKGLVQTQINLPDESQLRLTIARYYTPSGRCIQKPYERGQKEDYEKELLARLSHGEMSHLDSTHFSDSLKYYTRVLQRPVYGGGGIMPDIFIPIDTTWSTPLYRELAVRGLINRWATQYIEQNRNQLKAKYKKFEQFDKTYQISADAIAQLKGIAEESNVEWNEEQLTASSEMLHTQFKALMARHLWGMTEYFQITNRTNKSFIEGVSILKDGRYETQLQSPK